MDIGKFNLTKKTLRIAGAAVAGAVMIGMGGAYAAGQIAQNNSIDAATAQSFAFVDAGVLPENAQVIKSKFDFDDGMFLYEIEFVADGMFYDYHIKAADGTVLKKEVEGVKGYQATQVTNPGSGSSQAPQPAQPGSGSSQAPQQTQPGSGSSQTPQQTPQPVQPAQTAQISADEAFAKALAEAGVKEADAFLKKNHIDWENGAQVYEIEFFVKNADGSVTEYEYAVNAVTGNVVERSMEQELVKVPPVQANPGSGSAQIPQQTQPGSGSSQTPAQTQPTQPAQQQPVTPVPQQPVTPAPQGNYISVDQAKSIALSHAGVGTGATFIKAQLDHDDGRMVYEIEFYVGRTEYNVDVDAVSGTVVDYDMDYEDFD